MGWVERARRLLLLPLCSHHPPRPVSEPSTSLPILASSLVSTHSPFLPRSLDEEFINRSLLDSLDEQADAEPLFSSSEDEDHFPSSHRQRNRVASPTLNLANMYNPVEFDPGRDLAPAPYRTSTAFNSTFTNSNNARPRQQPVQSGAAAFLRDTSNFSQHFSVDSFAHTQPSQQHSSINDSLQPSHSAFDLSLASQPSAGQAPGSALFNKPGYNVDVFPGNSNS